MEHGLQQARAGDYLSVGRVDEPRPLELHRHTFRAMATDFEFLSRTRTPDRAALVFRTAELEVRRLERVFSRFIKASSIERLNESGSELACVELAEVVAHAMSARQTTGGLFDPTVYEALAVVRRDGTRAPAWKRGEVRVDLASGRIELAMGTKLDLGGIVKGWVVDRACAALAQAGSCVVNAGGDIAVHTVAGEPAWPIGLGGGLAIEVYNGGVATSAQNARKWVRAGIGGNDHHHVIDPSNGLPARRDFASVTVVAPTATAADAWATAFVVAGTDRAIALADEQGLSCAIELADGTRRMSAELGG